MQPGGRRGGTTSRRATSSDVRRPAKGTKGTGAVWGGGKGCLARHGPAWSVSQTRHGGMAASAQRGRAPGRFLVASTGSLAWLRPWSHGTWHRQAVRRRLPSTNTGLLGQQGASFPPPRGGRPCLPPKTPTQREEVGGGGKMEASGLGKRAQLQRYRGVAAEKPGRARKEDALGSALPAAEPPGVSGVRRQTGTRCSLGAETRVGVIKEGVGGGEAKESRAGPE